MKRFDILEIGGVKKIIIRIGHNEVKYYFPIDQIYDVIEAALMMRER